VTKRAFSFDGGAKAGSTVQAIFKTSLDQPLISLAHKVTFTDDTCLVASDIKLFNEAGQPLSSSIELLTVDAGTRENLKTAPAKEGFLASFNWNSFRKTKSEPQRHLAPSILLGSAPLAKITIEPY